MPLNLKIKLFILANFLSISAKSQYNLFSDFGSSAFADVKTHIGKPIVYSDSLNQSLRNTFWAIDYRFGINSFDRLPQDKFLKYSKYGIGFSHYQMNSDTIGNPMGLYGFFASPFFISNHKLKVGFELSTGFSFNFNPFDLVNNPKNDVIGSKMNVYFNLGLWSAMRITERLDLLASTDFTHFSNGTMNTPNKGLNLLGGNVGLRYHFQFEEKSESFVRMESTNKDYGKLKPYNEFTFWAAIGGKTVLTPTYDAPVFLCSTLSADFNRRYSWIGKYGFGADLFFDYSLVTDFPNEDGIPNSRFTFLGLHGTHEFIVGNFALGLQVGTYLWKGTRAKGNFYFRAGLKYDINRHIFVNLSLKSANGLKADYIEAGIGFRLGKRENTL